MHCSTFPIYFRRQTGERAVQSAQGCDRQVGPVRERDRLHRAELGDGQAEQQLQLAAHRLCPERHRARVRFHRAGPAAARCRRLLPQREA